jgi:hypothetical protein
MIYKFQLEMFKRNNQTNSNQYGCTINLNLNKKISWPQEIWNEDEAEQIQPISSTPLAVEKRIFSFLSEKLKKGWQNKVSIKYRIC